jgi:signal transduction histidine kinase/streptogramin lyase
MQVIKQRKRCDARGWIVLLVLLVLLPWKTLAQRLPLKTYTTADGLWNSAVYYIMRDSHQFLWLCTYDGLSRFDGSRFVNYKIPAAFPGQHFIFMLESHEGVYWIISDGGQLYRYGPQTTSTVGPVRGRVADNDGRFSLNAQRMSDESFSNVSFRTLYEDSSGNLWAGNNHGLALIERDHDTFKLQAIPLNLPPEIGTDVAISVISEGQDGSLWLGTSRGLLRLSRNRQVIHYAFGKVNDSEPVDSLLLDKDGRVWLGRRSGLLVFKSGPSAWSGSRTSLKFMSRLLNVHKPVMRGDRVLLPETGNEAADCTALAAGDPKRISAERTLPTVAGPYQHSNGQIWMIVHEQLAFFAEGRFHGYTGLYPAGLKLPFSQDLDGNLWIASPSGPIKVSVRGMKTYDNASGLKKLNIHGIREDSAGTLYVVSGAGDNLWVNRLSGGKFTPIHPDVPGPVLMAFLDHTGDWWIPAERGLYRYHLSRRGRFEDLARLSPSAVYTKTVGFSSGSGYNFEANNARSIFEDSKGDLWISTRDNHLAHWQRSTETFYTFTAANGWPPNEVAVSFAEDKAGNLWFGTEPGSLVRYRNARFTRFTEADGGPGVPIHGLYIDHDGRLWLASDSKGVKRIDDPTAEHPNIAGYTGSPGLLRTDTRCITEDLDGHIYFGAFGSGIDRLTPKTGDVVHYDATDGLASEYVWSAHRARDGTLWFATTKGVSQLDPLPDAKGGRSLTIMGLRISGRDYPMAEMGSAEIGPMELSATENSLEIDFASIGHTGPLLYQYKFEGRDRDWTTMNQATVRYERLAPGRYRLLLRVQSMDANSPAPAVITFRILAPIWQRWWFLGWMAAMATAIAVALYRYRVAQLLALERVRTRIASDLHDDIGSSLSQIAILSEVARLGPGPRPGLLSEIASMSRELVDSMSDIVWAIKPENDDLSNLIFRMRRFATDVLGGRNIALQFHSNVEDRDLRTNTEMRREVYLIFKEAISNIARHSGARLVRIELEVVKDDLILRITDNGCGFDPVSSDGGNGLRHMKKRAAGLGGKIEIRSSPGEGATITVKVPLASTRTLSKLIAQ